MTASSHTKMPRTLNYRADPLRPGSFQVVDGKGAVWAESIPNEASARVLAASPGLLLGYDELLEGVHAYFHMRWDVGHNGLDLEDFVEDEGELEDQYPGAPDYARWLRDLYECSRAARESEWESPIEPYVEPQSSLF